MNESIKKFILKSLLAAMPVLLFIAFYAWRDPFHVIHPVGTDINGRDSVMAGNNAGFLSVETYLAHNDERHYDSFIFGSSMSQNYKASYWKPHLDSTASILHFDASSETLDGIINKMNFLNNHGSTIKNALIVIESVMLTKTPRDKDILYVQHPATTGAHYWLDFHMLYFNAFRHLGIKKCLIGNDNVINEDVVDGHRPDRIEPINELYYGYIDSLIATAPAKYFTPKRLATRVHAPNYTPTGFSGSEDVEKKLLAIKQVLDKNKTNYIVLVPPCNAKPHLHPHDLWLMKTIFGQDKVHDFSSMPGYTRNEYLYYDKQGHLISARCKILLDSAYHEQNKKSPKNPFYKIKSSR
jgi:hypothetical protein